MSNRKNNSNEEIYRIVRNADAVGKSYGQYVAEMERKRSIRILGQPHAPTGLFTYYEREGLSK